MNLKFLFYLDLTKVIYQEITDNSDNELYSKQICSVCKTEDDGTYKCTCFSTSELENEMIKNFSICGTCNGDFNKVFEYCWNQQKELSARTKDKDVSYDSVFEKVWKPTIERCQALLSKLKDKTVTLQEVEILYQMDNLSLHLSVLCKAMQQCYPNLSEPLSLPDKWVPQTIAHIALYHNIANNPKCAEAANVILKVKTSLKLKGDFKMIEDLAVHVSICTLNNIQNPTHVCIQLAILCCTQASTT